MLRKYRFAASTVLVAGIAASFAAADPTTYYLRHGSTDYQGCFGTCDCITVINETLSGRFDLTALAPDVLFNNFAVTNAVFRGPTFQQTFAGSGLYQVGGDPASLQRMQLDLTVDGNTPLHWDSGFVTPTASAPAMGVVLTINDYECYDIVLTLRATPFRSDWNADGSIATSDIFDFLNTWLAGNADANDDGQTSTADIFEFLNDWFAGR